MSTSAESDDQPINGSKSLDNYFSYGYWDRGPLPEIPSPKFDQYGRTFFATYWPVPSGFLEPPPTIRPNMVDYPSTKLPIGEVTSTVTDTFSTQIVYFAPSVGDDARIWSVPVVVATIPWGWSGGATRADATQNWVLSPGSHLWKGDLDTTLEVPMWSRCIHNYAFSTAIWK
jgi:hypothetical protein